MHNPELDLVANSISSIIGAGGLPDDSEFNLTLPHEI